VANIIDSFFVQVGLDASQFTIGQREADQVADALQLSLRASLADYGQA
jgi:hypothetical protein